MKRKLTRIEKKKLKAMQEDLINMFGYHGYGWLLCLLINGLDYYAGGEEKEIELDTVTIKINGGYATTWYCDENRIDHYEHKQRSAN
jgi:hypothetical protein